MTADDMGSAKVMAEGQSSPPDETCETRVDLTRCMTTFDRDLLQKTHLTHVVIDCNGLVELPGNFGQCLCNLEVLSLNGNELHSIPDSFRFLTKLAELYLAHNALSSLPVMKYKCWTKLRVFDLSDNILERLPYDFGEMEALEKVYIEENRLKGIPPTFPLLKHLQVLEASRNKLEKLPHSMGLLLNLRLLNVASNNLCYLPESLGELEFLECLEVSKNCLEKLPSTFKSVHSLKRLYADKNPNLCCPRWLQNLSAIEEISVHSNNFMSADLGEDFGRNCKHLKRADFRGNYMSTLPMSFGEASQLECFLFGSAKRCADEFGVIQGNPISFLPDSLCKLIALTVLNFNECVLRLLPDDFGSLVNLKVLHVDGNILSELPKTFSHLQSLEQLSLSRNNLILLPSDFGHLTQLKYLSLEGNLLREMPESFAELRNLKSLNLCKNRLKEIPPYLDQLHLVCFDYTKNPGSKFSSSGRLYKCAHPKVADYSEKMRGRQALASVWMSFPRPRHHMTEKIEDCEQQDADKESQEDRESAEEEEEESWHDSQSETTENEQQSEEEDHTAGEFDEENGAYIPHSGENWDLGVDSVTEQWDLLDNFEPVERVGSSSMAPDEIKIYTLLHRGGAPPYCPEAEHPPNIVRLPRVKLESEDGQFDDV